jgi:hypothetical protein
MLARWLAPFRGTYSAAAMDTKWTLRGRSGLVGASKSLKRWWAVTDLNRGPSRCKRDALTAELTAP